MDKRENNGGIREGAGRKPKVEEQKLVELLSPHDNKALQVLISKIEQGEKWAVELFFKYRYGMPKQSVDLEAKGDISFAFKEIIKGFDTDN